jgi:predicted NBD/HSP70 family sugar kinase
MSSAAPVGPGSYPASLSVVLAHVWGHSEITSGEVMTSVGLTRTTTIEAIDSLVQLGLLEELPNARATDAYRKGRPARRFSFRDTAGYVVGVDLGHHHATVVVADLCGRQHARLHRDLDPGTEHPESRRGSVCAAVDDAIAEVGCNPRDVVAICAGVAAPVDGRGISPQHPSGFWQSMNPGLIDELRSRAPYVRVENDASLAAVAERTFGAAIGCQDYIALLAGFRLGAGVVIDGNLLRGAHGGVGEMSGLTSVEGVQGSYGLGARAEEWAKAAIATGEVDPHGRLAAVPPDELDGRIVLELAAQGDRDAARVADKLSAMLAHVVAVLGSVYDPQRVIICGAVATGIGPIVDAARHALPLDLDLPLPELIVSELGADIVVTGAVTTALELTREHALDIWMDRLPHRPTP